MNLQQILGPFGVLACVALSACASPPGAAPEGEASRAQVQAQLAEAIRLGDIQAGDSGMTMAELYPDRYAAARAQARAARAAALAPLAAH